MSYLIVSFVAIRCQMLDCMRTDVTGIDNKAMCRMKDVIVVAAFPAGTVPVAVHIVVEVVVVLDTCNVVHLPDSPPPEVLADILVDIVVVVTDTVAGQK